MRSTTLALLLLAAACARHVPARRDADAEWPVTGGEPGNSRYSPLRQIDVTNVARLRVAWTYHTGDASPRGATQIQATPVVVRGVLYATSATLDVFALRADTGEELWRFDPFAGERRASQVNRGVTYWEDGEDRRILVSAGRRLWALDAATGRPIRTFGDSGRVDLGAGLGRDVTGAYLLATSPGVIYRDLLVQGTRVAEGDGAAPGHVRAYDVRSGKVRWTFHTIPQPGEYGQDTWPADAWKTAGGANAWTGMSVDVARGLVYVPTGSATPDFWGGDRAGANLFANTLLALDARTGKRVWHFQTVHHDIWDRDLPTAPNLVTLLRGGRRVDALAQLTKTGFVFVLDRATGAPLFPVEERAVPPSDVPGERAWPTQPVALAPAPIGRQRITEGDLTDLTPAARAAALARWRTLREGGLFMPPSLQGTAVMPEFDGAGKWGGAAVDRETGVLYVNATDVPCIATLVPARPAAAASAAPRTGEAVYAGACASCHGADRRGDGDRSPSLVDVGARLPAAAVREVIERGRGFMPSFATLPAAERDAVTAYLLGRRDDSPHAAEPVARAPDDGAPRAPYRLRDYERWRDPEGYPAVKPPWGTLHAIDLNTGAYRWSVTLGEFAELTARGVPPTGTPSYGGPIVTAGGLVFIGATQDERFRAFDKRTGKLLWEARLPAAGYATPSTYMANGRQYVVIAAGGGKLGTRSGDAYVAFALPD